MESEAEQLLRTVDGLNAEMFLWTSIWDDLRRYIMPRRPGESFLPESPEYHCTVATRACTDLASGHITYITPINQRWFSYSPDTPNPEDKTISWFNKATEITETRLSASNFYTEYHEAYIDRCLYGTACVLCDEDLVFKHIPTGTYSIAENSRGIVDTLARSYKMSPYQAADAFGEENLGEKLREALSDPKKRYDVAYEFIHFVRPRDRKKVKSDGIDAKTRPFESFYISKDDKRIVKEDGFYEFPYMVTRFLRWGASPYGISPGMLCEPDIRRTRFLDDVLDTLAEVAAFPRVLELADMVGEVDMRAGGRTVITDQMAQLNLPREWATQGRYDIGMERLKEKNECIEKAFFVDMLRVISSIDREMTATEVMAREAEKVLAFSPSYTLFTNEVRPAMERIFSILLRKMEFGKPPVEAIDKSGGIPLPKVSYNGKISMAMERLQSEGTINGLSSIAQLIPFNENVMDIIDTTKAGRKIYRLQGGDEDLLRSEEQYDSIQAEKKERYQQIEQTELARQQSEAGKNAAAAAKTAKEAGLL